MTPQELQILHEVRAWAPLIAAAIALYVSLRVRPLEKRMSIEYKSLRGRVRRLEECWRDHEAQQHRQSELTERWRGRVDEMLSRNDESHKVMLNALGDVESDLHEAAENRKKIEVAIARIERRINGES